MTEQGSEATAAEIQFEGRSCYSLLRGRRKRLASLIAFGRAGSLLDRPKALSVRLQGVV